MSKLTEFHENGWDVSAPIGPKQTNPLMFTSNVWRQTGAPELAEFLLKRGLQLTLMFGLNWNSWLVMVLITNLLIWIDLQIL